MLEYAPHSPEHTLLHRVIREELEPFLARACARERPAHFVEQELRAFLGCGILAHGFLRLRCDDCGHDRLVAFWCKRRGFCPSCDGRRMAGTAAYLVDRVLPIVPVRQWVLTLPHPLRYRCACDRELASQVLRAFLRSLLKRASTARPPPLGRAHRAVRRRHPPPALRLGASAIVWTRILTTTRTPRRAFPSFAA